MEMEIKSCNTLFKFLNTTWRNSELFTLIISINIELNKRTFNHNFSLCIQLKNFILCRKNVNFIYICLGLTDDFVFTFSTF